MLTFAHATSYVRVHLVIKIHPETGELLPDNFKKCMGRTEHSTVLQQDSTLLSLQEQL